ncbi:fibronectin type III domain-containing protein [Stanieria cyanosphaera PCC 7437]|uniref:Fibronectin type III domain-containing protein n=1 Tax=Stanieria cyanosphaera (strain ATCC 29371 / PCC 7437) TaxID=111780 RepID=K9XQ54_STAC7|nr:hypothetical protein [Stanieria cyanosphaera]AFZ34176.1 fibronectin type III domain-containing protein [Stanieria cyanosphaera PCC 7437]
MILVIFILVLISWLGLKYNQIFSRKNAPQSNNISEINNLVSLLPKQFCINVWYGLHQNFGHLGNPQRFINILGNISIPDHNSIKSTTYTINSSDEIPFFLGSDQHRLAETGDFNLEINLNELIPGENNIVINATNTIGKSISQKVVVNYTSNQQWSLPYYVDFAKVKNIQDVAQIVDGKWILERGGARTVFPYYDRILAFGEMNWENYEVLAEVTINDFIPPFKKPPSYNVTHFGIGAGWRGHHDDDYQPRRKWYPLGAAMEFTLNSNLRNCRWRMFAGGLGKGSVYAEQKKGKLIELGKRYIYKISAKTEADSSTLYQTKVWSANEEEPLKWELEARHQGGDCRKGSVVLAAHNTDVTIWKVEIKPLYSGRSKG